MNNNNKNKTDSSSKQQGDQTVPLVTIQKRLPDVLVMILDDLLTDGGFLYRDRRRNRKIRPEHRILRCEASAGAIETPLLLQPQRIQFRGDIAIDFHSPAVEKLSETGSRVLEKRKRRDPIQHRIAGFEGKQKEEKKETEAGFSNLTNNEDF